MKFEKVSRFAAADFNLPVRKTKGAAGYDMEIAEDVIVPPAAEVVEKMLPRGGYEPFLLEHTLEEMAHKTKAYNAKPTLVSTGVKCQLDPGYYLELSVRSSTPLKYWLILANSKAVIDADYYNNEANEGEIFLQLINLSPFPIQLHKGDIIAQGIIHKYYTIDEEEPTVERIGGLGSTTQTIDNSLHLGACAVSPQEIKEGLDLYQELSLNNNNDIVYLDNSTMLTKKENKFTMEETAANLNQALVDFKISYDETLEDVINRLADTWASLGRHGNGK